jgi:hypothetical protein
MIESEEMEIEVRPSSSSAQPQMSNQLTVMESSSKQNSAQRIMYDTSTWINFLKQTESSSTVIIN